MSNSLEIIRKRLLWRATHRGIKEMDMVLGGFAIENIHRMSAAELEQFAILLDIPDQDLLAWLTNQEIVPPHLASPMLHHILAFRPETNE